MKKFIIKLLLIVLTVVLVATILNVSVITKQGVNYKVREIRMPLYLKLLDYVDRHYNYKNLVVNILGDTRDDGAKAIKILNWVNANVRKNPAELPVIDDHPLNILIRGYGERDQFEDIFTILCTYAKMKAFYGMFRNNSGGYYFVSFVKVNGRWCPISAYARTYAEWNKRIASVDDIMGNKELLGPFANKIENFESDAFLNEITKIDFEQTSMRSSGQAPFRRIMNLLEAKMKKGR
jgi:hypothetical protein